MTGSQTQQVFDQTLQPCTVEPAGLLVDQQGGTHFDDDAFGGSEGEAVGAGCAGMVRKLYAKDAGLSLGGRPFSLPGRMAAPKLAAPRDQGLFKVSER